MTRGRRGCCSPFDAVIGETKRLCLLWAVVDVLCCVLCVVCRVLCVGVLYALDVRVDWMCWVLVADSGIDVVCRSERCSTSFLSLLLLLRAAIAIATLRHPACTVLSCPTLNSLA